MAFRAQIGGKCDWIGTNSGWAEGTEERGDVLMGDNHLARPGLGRYLSGTPARNRYWEREREREKEKWTGLLNLPARIDRKRNEIRGKKSRRSEIRIGTR